MPGSKAGGAGRVIAGTARGRRLLAPGEGTRPLGDRLKEALFAILEPEVRGRAFLDLFAGSGAGGIEALSRGATRAVFVERERGAVQAIVANLKTTALADSATVIRADATAWLQSDGRTAGPFVAALVDPPYDHPDLLAAALRALEAAGPDGIVTGSGVVVAKHFWKTEPAPTRLLRSVRRERFGDTILTFYRWADEVDA